LRPSSPGLTTHWGKKSTLPLRWRFNATQITRIRQTDRE
jgi:hypothetical protein